MAKQRSDVDQQIAELLRTAKTSLQMSVDLPDPAWTAPPSTSRSSTPRSRCCSARARRGSRRRAVPGRARRRPAAGHARPQGLPGGDGAAGGAAARASAASSPCRSGCRDGIAVRHVLRRRAHQRPRAHRARPGAHGGAGLRGRDPRRARACASAPAPSEIEARLRARGRGRRARRAPAADRRPRHRRAHRRRGAQPLPAPSGARRRTSASPRPTASGSGHRARAARPRAGRRAPRRRLGLRRDERLARRRCCTPSAPSCSDRLPLDRVLLELSEHDQVEDYDALAAVLQPLRAPGPAPGHRRRRRRLLLAAPHRPRPRRTSSSSTAASSTASPATRCCARWSGRWSTSPTAAARTVVAEGIETAEDAAALLDARGRPRPGLALRPARCRVEALDGAARRARRRRHVPRVEPRARPAADARRAGPAARRAGARGRRHGDADGLRRRPAPILGCDLSSGPRAAHGDDRAHRQDPGPLLDLLPEDGALAWVTRGEGLVGWGEAARFDVGPRDRPLRAGAEQWWRALVARATSTTTCGCPAPAWWPSARSPSTASARRSVLVVPEVVVGHRDGTWWTTRISDGRHQPAGLPRAAGPPVRRPAPSATPTARAAAPAWTSVVAAAVDRIAAGEVAKVVLARDLEARTEAAARRPVAAAPPGRRLPRVPHLRRRRAVRRLARGLRPARAGRGHQPGAGRHHPPQR